MTSKAISEAGVKGYGLSTSEKIAFGLKEFIVYFLIRAFGQT